MSQSALEGRILVTGGAGLIGSAVIWFLNQLGYQDILVADALDSSDKWKNLAALSFFDYVEGRELLAALDTMSPPSCVFHLGACSSTQERDAAYLMSNNYAFTRDLAAWCLARGVRFVYASSAATYGDGARGFSEELPLADLRPLNAYGYSKHLFDRHAQAQGWLKQLVGIKYFNVYGPNEQHKGDMRSLVHKAYEQICSTGRLALFKSHRPDFAHGEQRRDFLYVKEAAQATVALATSSAAGLYNLGSGQAHTWNRLAEAIFAALQRAPQVEYIDMPESLRDRYQYHTQADLGRIQALGLDYRCYSLDLGVQDYLVNYLIPERRLGDESLGEKFS